MPHVRQQIRDRLEVILKGLPTTKQRVFSNKFYTLSDDDLECIVIATQQEKSELMCKAPRSMKRLLPVEIECKAKRREKQKITDVIDDMISEAETAIGADNTLNGLVQIINISSTDIIFSTDQEKPVGSAKLVFDALYYTEDGAPEVAQ